MKFVKPTIAFALLLPLTACNAGAIAMGVMAQRFLRPLATAGTVSNPPAAIKVGYLAWTELPNEGAPRGQLDFNLTEPKTVEFDQTVTPRDNRFSLQITPGPDTAEGTYVMLAWDDVNNDGRFQGEQGEKRAAEVYRIRGQASTSNFWTAEMFFFTDKRLEIRMVQPDGGLSFSF
ncbi:MAG: hypothetical protein VKN33_06740 [Candidatus Sericytochromatia bacterium]|nr:hypothetical protein [Candidatus Sericytochromatia bacterium]